MSTQAIFNRRVYDVIRRQMHNALVTLKQLPTTGEAIDNEVARVKRLLELVLQEPKVPVDKDAPICRVHQVPMTKRQGKYGSFWSCGQKTNGVWCSYRP
jgi:hypothetical protein